MAHPHFHAVSSARKWGGKPEDYLAIHEFFDQTKSALADFRHRAVLHNTFGIFLCEQVFGSTLEISACKRCGNGAMHDLHTSSPEDPDFGDQVHAFQAKLVPVRPIGEQHVLEDLGCIPPLADWLRCIVAEPWMNRSRRLSHELEREEAAS